VFGPTLLGAGSSNSLLTDFTANQKVMETMIKNYDAVFHDTEEERKQEKIITIKEQEAEEKKQEMRRKRITERLDAFARNNNNNTTAPHSIRKSFFDRPPPGGTTETTGGRSPATASEPGQPPRTPPPTHLGRKPLPRLPGSAGPETLPESVVGTAGSSPTISHHGLRTSSKAPPLPPTPVTTHPGTTSADPVLSSNSLVSNIRSLPPGSVVKQGWLTKKGGQRRNWKTRWFVLKTNELSYYNNKKDVKAKGTVILSGVTVKPSAHKEFCFAVSTAERTYLMAGKDATEQEEWVAALSACIRGLD